MAEWTNKKVLNLIRMYRDRPLLWDPKDDNYKDKVSRHQEVTEIATNLHETKEEVDRKIKNLLSHFSRELKKEGRSSKCGTIPCYKSKWFAYEAMLFLKDKQRPRKTVSDGNEVDVSSEDEDMVEDPLQIPITKEQIEVRPQHALKELPTKKRKLEDTLENEVESRKDEFSLFGELVAIKLRQLPTDRSRTVVQHIINTALFDGYMGKYDNPGPFGTDWAYKGYPANSTNAPSLESYTYGSQTSEALSLSSPGSRNSRSLMTTEPELSSHEALDIKVCLQ